jgi:Uma2 family endonuclease
MEQAIDPYASRRYTPEEYFDLAEASEEKLEFRDGEILMMAGGTESHSLIIANVVGELRARLKAGPCRVYDSNLRVRARTNRRYTYPDALVVCGERQFDPRDKKKLTVTNPTLVVEVLSDTTERTDRGEKFLAYIRAELLERIRAGRSGRSQIADLFPPARRHLVILVCRRQGRRRPPAEFRNRSAAERGVCEGGTAGAR